MRSHGIPSVPRGGSELHDEVLSFRPHVVTASYSGERFSPRPGCLLSISSGMGILAAARRGGAFIDLFHVDRASLQPTLAALSSLPTAEPSQVAQETAVAQGGDVKAAVRLPFLMSRRMVDEEESEGCGVQALGFLSAEKPVLAVVVAGEIRVFELAFRAWFGAVDLPSVETQATEALATRPVLWQLRVRVRLGQQLAVAHGGDARPQKLVQTLSHDEVITMETGQDDDEHGWIAVAFRSGAVTRAVYPYNMSAKQLAAHSVQLKEVHIGVEVASCAFGPGGMGAVFTTKVDGAIFIADLEREIVQRFSPPLGTGRQWVTAQWVVPGESVLAVRKDGMRKLIAIPSGAELVSFQALSTKADSQWLLPVRPQTKDGNAWVIGAFTTGENTIKLYGLKRFDKPASAVLDILRRGMWTIPGTSILGCSICRLDAKKLPAWALEFKAPSSAEFAVAVLTDVGVSFFFIVGDDDKITQGKDERSHQVKSSKCNNAFIPTHANKEQDAKGANKPTLSSSANMSQGGAKKTANTKQSNEILKLPKKGPPKLQTGVRAKTRETTRLSHANTPGKYPGQRIQSESSPQSSSPRTPISKRESRKLGSDLAQTVQGLETRVKQAELDLRVLRTEFKAFTSEMSQSLDELAKLVVKQREQR